MNLLVPAALAFSAIIPIILLLYFMRPKRQERVVSSTLLWQQVLQDLQASRPWQRLRVTPLLLLQLLAAVVVILVLTRPAIFTNSPISGNTVIILQASASMQATDIAPNRFENAKSSIANFIDTLGPNDRLSLITMSRTPQVLIAESQDKEQLHAALQHAQVTNQDADLEQTLSLATSLITGHANSQVLIIGDGHVMAPDQALTTSYPVHYMHVGTSAPNVALMALDSRILSGKLIAFAQVTNYSRQQRSIPIELYADGKLVGVQTVTLAAGATSAVQWTSISPTARFLHARLVSQDVMTIDHDAWAIAGGSMHGRALLVTKGNSFLETALRLQPNIDLFETTPDKYVNTSSYDLTIFDGYVPPHLPNNAIFFVNPPNGSYLFGTVGPETQISRISAVNDTLNILNAVDLSSIHVLHASHQIKPANWTQTVITAPEAPLLIAGENNNQRIAILGFDLHQSDLPLQPAFPILIHNMTNWFLPQPVPESGQVTPGIPITLQTWPGVDKITITSPSEQVTSVGPPVIPYANTNQTGIYQVTQHVRGQNLQGAFAVNLFDASQSNLVPAKSLPIANSQDFTSGGNVVSHELREVWPWIAALLLLILCAEWWLFSRGYQHQNLPPNIGAYNSMRGTASRRIRNTFAARLQDQLEEQYRLAKKRSIKAIKRARGTLARKTSKGDRRANI